MIKYYKTKELIFMKRTIKTVSALLMMALLVALTIIPSFAAKDTLVVNSQDKLNIKKGDIVTYELDLGDCTEDVIGLQANLFYDNQYLKYVEDSLEFPSLKSVVSNPSLDNRITFNWTDITDTADFSKSKPFVKASFEVLKGGETEITYFISELYGDDMTYLKDYTFTYELYVNDKKVVKDETPVVEQDKDNLNLYQGTFINYADGKGENNGSGDSHVSIVGESQKVVPTDVSQGDVETGGQPAILPTVLVILGIVVVLVGIIVIIVVRNIVSKKEK